MIPKVIYQSWKTKNLPENMKENVELVRSLNPEYTYVLYDDGDCRNFLLKECGKEYLDAFDALISGAFKCDFWRYAMLYKYGGYLTVVLKPQIKHLLFSYLKTKIYNTTIYANTTMEQYISTKEARKILGVTSQTLRNWSDQGKIGSIISPSGVHLYSKQNVYGIANVSLVAPEKRKIAYCRVGSQKDDLKRQTDFFREKYPDCEVVTDVASGLNWKRRGFQAILESAMSGDISELVVAHKDRLCRFSFDIIKTILEHNKVKLTVLDADEYESRSEELADDVISLLRVYTSGGVGKGRYKNKKNPNLPNSRTAEDSKEVDGDD